MIYISLTDNAFTVLWAGNLFLQSESHRPNWDAILSVPLPSQWWPGKYGGWCANHLFRLLTYRHDHR